MNGEIDQSIKLKWIVYSIIFSQATLCIIETIRAIKCHESGSECWPWFYVFVINIPASALFETVFGIIVEKLVVETFTMQTALRFIIYLLGGSLWWMLIVLLVRSLVRRIKRKIQSNQG